MDLSIIIVNINERGFLKQFLKGIERAKIRCSYEIIVADNGSTDGSVEMMQEHFPGIKLITFPKNRGLSVAFNAAVKRARGEYILYMNNDIAVFEGVIDELLGYLQRNPKIGVLAPKLLNPDRSVQMSCYKFQSPMVPVLRRTPLGKLPAGKRILKEYLMLDFDHDAIQTVDWILGAVMMLRRTALNDVGGMDERYFAYYEDADLCRQMWAHGWQVVYYAPVQLIHYHQRTSAASPGLSIILNKFTRIHIRSGIKYFLKYKRQPLPDRPHAQTNT